MATRAGWLLESATTYEKRVGMAHPGMRYWWLKRVDHWDLCSVFPQSAGGRTVRPTPPPRTDAIPRTDAVPEYTGIFRGWWIQRYNRGLSRTLPSVHGVADTLKGHKLTGEQIRCMCSKLFGVLVVARQRLSDEHGDVVRDVLKMRTGTRGAQLMATHVAVPLCGGSRRARRHQVLVARPRSQVRAEGARAGAIPRAEACGGSMM